ncbi:hypothetical protein QL285_092822 [Trifolium repens]|nr:hypothetical protein QL285_092822 [Trifolium repens]
MFGTSTMRTLSAIRCVLMLGVRSCLAAISRQHSQPVLPNLRTSGIILAGKDDSGSKLNGLGDASISDSTPSHANYSLPASGQTPSTEGRTQMPMYGRTIIIRSTFTISKVMHYYPGNMQWPPNEDRSHNDKTSYKKKKKKNKQSQVADHEEDESTTSSEYTDESDSDADSKQKELFNGAYA